MRRLLYLCLLLTTFTIAHAQTEKGHWMVGATTSGLGFQIQKGSFGLNLSPHTGFFLIDRLALGTKLSFSLSRVTADNGQGSTLGFGATPFVRYFIPITEKLSIPVNVELGWGASFYDSGASSGSTTGVTGAGTAGIAFFPSHHVSLDFLAGYSRSRLAPNITGPVSGKGAFVGSWGASLYFGK